MSTTEEHLNSFTQFVHSRLQSTETEPSAEPSLGELFDLWSLENPGDMDYAENVAAVNASISDFENGERGTPAGEHSRQLRQQMGFANK